MAHPLLDLDAGGCRGYAAGVRRVVDACELPATVAQLLLSEAALAVAMADRADAEAVEAEEACGEGLVDAVGEGLADAVGEGLADAVGGAVGGALAGADAGLELETGSAGPRWSAQRVEVLRRTFPTVMPVEDILSAVNRLPGASVASVAALREKARQLELRRSRFPVPEQDFEAPTLSSEDLHEAREQLRRGAGARALCEEFGGGLGWWQAWCEEGRAAA
jgi:hypothetical protein